MIPQTHDRTVTGTADETTKFGIALDQQAHIMRILRDTMYSDKVLAVLREYSSNAWDAHRDSGQPDLPIKVVMPTNETPVLSIRDFGTGLSQHDVHHHFTQFGASSKRDSNDVVGSLGVGCKAGHAYSDTFTVTSWFGGTKSVYVAVIDASDEGEMRRVHEEPCGDETGLEIKVAVVPSDIYTFQDRARNLFRYFEPRPDINLHLPAIERRNFKEGFLSEGTYGWTAIMGCVPYRLDLNQVQEELIELGLWECLNDISGGVYFPIGAVQFNAGREELRYSGGTKDAIVERLKALVDEYVEDTLTILADPTIENWDKRLRATYLARKLNLPIPGKYKDWGVEWVMLTTTDGVVPTKFRMTNNSGDNVSRIMVTDSACLYFKDDARPLKGFQMGSGSLIIQPVGGATDWEAELDTFLAKAKIEGIPTKLLSTLPWYAPATSGRVANVKHRVSTFAAKDGNRHSSGTLSKNWEVEKRTPTNDDVFVVMSAFEPLGLGTGFYAMLNEDRRLAKRFGKTFPTIYGYKTTARKPLTAKDCKGTEYRTWRRAYFKTFITRKWIDLRRADEWSEIIEDAAYYERREFIKGAEETLKATLGEDHPIIQLIAKRADARKVVNKCNGEMRLCRNLWQRIGKGNKRRTPPQIVLDGIHERYPLLKAIVGETSLLSVMNKETYEGWMDYIHLKDEAVSS